MLQTNITFLMQVALSNLNKAITPSKTIKIVRIPVNSGVKFAYPTGSILKYEYTSIVRSVGLVAKTITAPTGSISKINAIPCNTRATVYSCGNVPSFRRNGYRCSGRSIPSDRNRIPPASFWLVRVYSLNAGSSPYTSLMDL